MNDLNPFTPALGKSPIGRVRPKPGVDSDKSNLAQRRPPAGARAGKERQGRNCIAQRPVGN